MLTCCAGARRDSHKPNEVLELQNFAGKILAAGGKAGQGNSLASKCLGGAFSGNMDGGAGKHCVDLQGWHVQSVK